LTDFETRLCDALALAALVRDAQENYFRGGRPREQLIASKVAEKKFDDIVGPMLAEARTRGWAPQ
jgi:hypothetical protein